MISFLFEEGVLTVGTMSGLFTAAMLNSFRVNILEPSIDIVLPSYLLDNQFGNILDPSNIVMNGGDNNTGNSSNNKNNIKWQTFLRDLITWLIVMCCLYIFWKSVLNKYRKV